MVAVTVTTDRTKKETNEAESDKDIIQPRRAHHSDNEDMTDKLRVVDFLGMSNSGELHGLDDIEFEAKKEKAGPRATRRSSRSRSSNARSNQRQGEAYRAAIRKSQRAGKRTPKRTSTRTRGAEEFYVSKRVDTDVQHDRMADTDDYKWDDGRRQFLCKELQTSHEIMRDIDYSIKDDMLLVHRTCRSIAQTRVANPNLRLKLQRLGAEAAMAECAKVSLRLQSNALRHWLSVVKEERRIEKLHRYKKRQSLGHLKACFDHITRRRLAWACLCWIDEMERQRNDERISAAIMVQSQWRIKKAVDTAEKLRTNKWHWAIATVQRFGKGRSARIAFMNVVLERNKLNAALVLQRSIRCRSARLVLAQRRRRREDCAIVLQRAARGQGGRRVAMHALEERRQRAAAVHIQRISRGRRDQIVVVQKREVEVKRNLAARTVQKHIRRRYDAKVVVQIKKEREKERKQKEHSTVILQRAYRGHRERGTIERTLEMKTKRRHSCATSIQCLYRGFVAKQEVKVFQRNAKALMIVEAREWIEAWSDEANAFYYYNKSTNESLRHAPLTGYTNADGQLALQNGQVILDPALVNNKSSGDVTKCDDCGIKHDFVHYCEQCEAVFCNECVAKSHVKEEFALHNRKRIDLVRPIESDPTGISDETLAQGHGVKTGGLYLAKHPRRTRPTLFRSPSGGKLHVDVKNE